MGGSALGLQDDTVERKLFLKMKQGFFSGQQASLFTKARRVFQRDAGDPKAARSWWLQGEAHLDHAPDPWG